LPPSSKSKEAGSKLLGAAAPWTIDTHRSASTASEPPDVAVALDASATGVAEPGIGAKVAWLRDKGDRVAAEADGIVNGVLHRGNGQSPALGVGVVGKQAGDGEVEAGVERSRERPS
jgi:hypothetical protein